MKNALVNHSIQLEGIRPSLGNDAAVLIFRYLNL